MARHVIAPVDELPPGTRKFLTIDERPIAIFNIKGEFFGLLNRCPHQGAALCEGPLIGLAQSSDPGEIEYTRLGEIIRCPWHGWEFDIRTGQSYCDPKRFRVTRLSRQCRAGHQRGEGAVCRRDDRGVGRERLRGGGSVAAAVPVNAGRFAIQTASLATFSGDALTDLLAGLAANSIGSFVNGLMPLRASVAGLFTTDILTKPGMTNSPDSFSSL